MPVEDYSQFTSRVDLAIRLPSCLGVIYCPICPLLCLVFLLLFLYWGSSYLGDSKIHTHPPTFYNSLSLISLLLSTESVYVIIESIIIVHSCTYCGQRGGCSAYTQSQRGGHDASQDEHEKQHGGESQKILASQLSCDFVHEVTGVSLLYNCMFSPPYDDEREQPGFSVLKIRFSKSIAKFLHLCACTVALTQNYSGYAQGVRDGHMTIQAKPKRGAQEKTEK